MQTRLKIEEREQERVQIWGKTKCKHIDDEFRRKVSGLLLRTILDRHNKKINAKYFYRMFEHASLKRLSEIYKQDMEANQEDFV